MRYLADENISGTVIRELRENGHDVTSAKEAFAGAADEEVLATAQKERRVVLTHDKDFAELAFRLRMPAESGIVLFRLTGDNPREENRRVLEALRSPLKWAGHFSVVTNDRIRVRPLPRPRDS